MGFDKALLKDFFEFKIEDQTTSEAIFRQLRAWVSQNLSSLNYDTFYDLTSQYMASLNKDKAQVDSTVFLM